LSSSPSIDFTGYRHNDTTVPAAAVDWRAIADLFTAFSI
jgi:hypothetical protein